MNFYLNSSIASVQNFDGHIFLSCCLTFWIFIVQRAYLQMENITNYTGIEGNITVYNPQFKDGQTYANMYVHNGMEEYINSIATGWMVS